MKATPLAVNGNDSEPRTAPVVVIERPTLVKPVGVPGDGVDVGRELGAGPHGDGEAEGEIGAVDCETAPGRVEALAVGSEVGPCAISAAGTRETAGGLGEADGDNVPFPLEGRAEGLAGLETAVDGAGETAGKLGDADGATGPAPVVGVTVGLGETASDGAGEAAAGLGEADGGGVPVPEEGLAPGLDVGLGDATADGAGEIAAGADGDTVPTPGDVLGVELAVLALGLADGLVETGADEDAELALGLAGATTATPGEGQTVPVSEASPSRGLLPTRSNIRAMSTARIRQSHSSLVVADRRVRTAGLIMGYVDAGVDAERSPGGSVTAAGA